MQAKSAGVGAMAMAPAATIREIHVDTRSNGCYLKERSSFHMNLPGLNIPSGKELYVNVSDFRLPVIEKCYFCYVLWI